MEFGHYPEGTVPQWLFEKATREISDYSVSLSIDNAPAGSGTLVSFGRKFGILTAAHVLRHLERGRDSHFAIVYALRITHRLLLDKRYIGSVRLDSASDESQGPDLALVIINDPACISTLKARKSFYSLSGRGPTYFSQLPRQSALCFVFGAPAEFSTEQGEPGTPEHILLSTHFAGRAQVTGEFSNGGYDCLEFGVRAGDHGFPSSYGGVSGGGVWHIPVTLDPDRGLASISYKHVELIGVAFYQSPDESGGRILTAQSFTSFPALLSKTDEC
jgi:hypothetical protein